MDRDGYAGPACKPDGYGGWNCPSPTTTTSTAPPATLPVTGHDTAVALGSGTLALLAGLGLVLLARRRRRAELAGLLLADPADRGAP